EVDEDLAELTAAAAAARGGRLGGERRRLVHRSLGLVGGLVAGDLAGWLVVGLLGFFVFVGHGSKSIVCGPRERHYAAGAKRKQTSKRKQASIIIIPPPLSRAIVVIL